MNDLQKYRLIETWCVELISSCLSVFFSNRNFQKYRPIETPLNNLLFEHEEKEEILPPPPPFVQEEISPPPPFVQEEIKIAELPPALRAPYNSPILEVITHSINSTTRFTRKSLTKKSFTCLTTTKFLYRAR